MKTSKKTLRGTITSSILTMALVASMMPTAGAAFAVEQMPADADSSSVASEQPAEAALSDDQVQDSAERDSEADAPNGSADAAASADVQAADSADAASDEAAPESAAAPAYTTDAIDRIQANVPVSADEVVLGNIEYAGLTYRINPDGVTVALVGLGTDSPENALYIPSQVAAGGKLYAVTGIKNCSGGGQR